VTTATLASRTEHTVVTVTVWLTLADAEPRHTEYSRVAGRMYQPLSAKLTYERRDSGSWDVKVVLLGVGLWKDGRLGRQETSERFWSDRGQPEWLRVLVDEYTPAVTS
jgi:hypothetical protein